MRCVAAAEMRDALPALGVQAHVAAARGDLQAAKTLARDAVALHDGTDYVERHAATLLTLAVICAASGDSEESVSAARLALDLSERKGNVVGAARARAVLDARGVAASAC